MTRIRFRTAAFTTHLKRRSINMSDRLPASMNEEQVEEIIDRFDRIAEEGERRDQPQPEDELEESA